MHRCLKKNGRLILAEGTSQGRRNLNKMRVAVGLKRMPRVWHNIDIDEKKLMPFIGRLFTVERDIRFGTYDVLTRVYHPKMVFPREPKYGSAFHAAAYDLCSRLKEDPFREYCREFIMVLRKR